MALATLHFLSGNLLLPGFHGTALPGSPHPSVAICPPCLPSESHETFPKGSHHFPWLQSQQTLVLPSVSLQTNPSLRISPISLSTGPSPGCSTVIFCAVSLNELITFSQACFSGCVPSIVSSRYYLLSCLRYIWGISYFIDSKTHISPPAFTVLQSEASHSCRWPGSSYDVDFTICMFANLVMVAQSINL